MYEDNKEICTKVHKNYLNRLCPNFKKNGICFDLECELFHPKKNCKLGLKCKRIECSFKHPPEYYSKHKRSQKIYNEKDFTAFIEKDILPNLKTTLRFTENYSLF